jgi:hypothetical protein
MRYTRTSVLRRNGQSPLAITALRARNRRLAERAENFKETMNVACGMAARLLTGMSEISQTTTAVVERARDRGTEASGTVRMIDRIARDSIGF